MRKFQLSPQVSHTYHSLLTYIGTVFVLLGQTHAAPWWEKDYTSAMGLAQRPVSYAEDKLDGSTLPQQRKNSFLQFGKNILAYPLYTHYISRDQLFSLSCDHFVQM